MVRISFMTALFAASSWAAAVGSTGASALVEARDAGPDGALAARALTPADKTRIKQLQDLNAAAEQKPDLSAGEAEQINTRNRQIEQIQAKGAA